MTDPAAPAALASARATDVFFTETIVGRPLSLPLGRRAAWRSSEGLQVSRAGTSLAQHWREDLENNAWRYALPLRSAVQRKAGGWRLFLERHALRVAVLALLVMVIAPLAYLAAAWQAGLLDGVWPLLQDWVAR